MKKILLTSTGFDNPKLRDIFLENVGREPAQIRALFIPTAAVDEDAKEVVPLCYQELIDTGLIDQNIKTYNLDSPMTYEELHSFDAVYFCGGSETHLMLAIIQADFSEILLRAIEDGLFFIGVSAGSMIASSSIENNLGIIPNPLEPHCEENITPCGDLPEPGTPVNLSDNQAVWICGNRAQIIE